jgi:hypothetical protein
VGNDRRQRKNQADEEKSLLHIITLLLFHNQLITHQKYRNPRLDCGVFEPTNIRIKYDSSTFFYFLLH